MRHLLHSLELLALAALVSLYGCGGSSSDISGDRSDRATSPKKKISSPRRPIANLTAAAGRSPRRSLLNENEPHPTDGPAWISATSDDDDSDKIARLQALDDWISDPGEALDPLTYALVDPDETVRFRAQELLEEELARR